MKNVKIWAPLAVAMILGLIAAQVGKHMISANRTVGAPGPKMVSVAVASDDVIPGTQLTNADVTIGQLPAANAPAGTFTNLDDVIGRVAEAPLVKGQTVLESMLTPTGGAAGLTAIVPVGMRAITLEVNEVSGVAGLITPGCHIDIVSTFSDDPATYTPPMARMIAENMLVIAVGQDFNTKPAKVDPTAATNGNPPPPPPAPAHTVTLLATPHDAELIALASHISNPRLVLRGSRDNSYGGASRVTLTELRGMSVQPPIAIPAAAPATQPAPGIPAGFQPPVYRDIQVIRNGVESTTRVDARTAAPIIMGSGY